MPAPLPVPVRQNIWQLAMLHGLTPSQIAQRLGLPVRTVQALVRRFTHRGQAAILPDYPAAAATPSAYLREALDLRRLHPTWGAGRIRVELQLRHPQAESLPCTRTIERWCRRLQQPTARAGRPSQNPCLQASRPHEVWEMDAAEQKRLANRQQISWLRLVDAYSGAVLGTRVFPPGLLHTGACQCRPGRVANSLQAVGLAPVAPGGQRLALG